jgi:hypothetical protein
MAFNQRWGLNMNFFDEVEGLKGENFVTAVFRFLLLRSEELREGFINLVSDECHLGPITSGEHFACMKEKPTEDQESGRYGRLDLIIEISDAVIGVENKLFAGFQEGQPGKYLETLSDQSKKLKDLRGTDFRHVLVILAPSRRSDEIKAKIIGNDHYVFLSWEKVIKTLTDPARLLDPMTAVILQGFKQFIEGKMAFMPHFSKWVPHLKRRFDPYGSPLQRKVVNTLWDFFPGSSQRPSQGDKYYGYYFCNFPTPHSAWYGFVDQSFISEGSANQAELIIVTSFPASLDTPPFRPIILKQKDYLGEDKEIITAWAVDYQKDWDNPKKWSDELRPLTASIGEMAIQPSSAKD